MKGDDPERIERDLEAQGVDFGDDGGGGFDDGDDF
jgi:hypothetical protein